MSIVPDRPVAYDPELFWDEENGEWTAVQTEGGGRYKSQLVVVGQNDSGDGVIYYGES